MQAGYITDSLCHVCIVPLIFFRERQEGDTAIGDVCCPRCGVASPARIDIGYIKKRYSEVPGDK